MKKEKIYNILLFILIFISILSIIILKPINDLDELWNYNFARNIADGLIPYRDFNMLQMPLLPLICGIILKLICNELIVMRILAGLLCAGIMYLTYKLFNILEIKKEIAMIFTFVILYLFMDVFCIDYNYATLLLALSIIFNEIKFYKEDNRILKADLKNDIFLGILAGLTITLKQTTGLFICIALLGNKLIFVRKKEEFRIYLKTFLYRFIGILIPVLLIIIYLITNNAWNEFISYTIKGVSGFSNYISYTNLIKFGIIGILSILVPITFIYNWIKTIILEKDKISYIFLVYGLAMFIVCFPISDKIHFLIGALPTLIIILYKIYRVLIKVFRKRIKSKHIKNFILVYTLTFTILFFIVFSITNIYKYYQCENQFSKLSHFRYIPIEEDLEKQIKNVDEYILTNENVKILDATASIYMIPIDKYNKDYDMFLKGNLGFAGEEKIMQQISTSKNTKYLILKDNFSKNWQTPLNVIEYLKNNKTKIGEIEVFDIYE